jgi:hypothetical protein
VRDRIVLLSYQMLLRWTWIDLISIEVGGLLRKKR